MAWMSKGGSALGGGAATVLEPAADGKIHFPSGDFLFGATFVHSGSDLKLVGHDGHTVLIPRYFESATPPPLVAPNDALLNGDTVRLLAGPAHPAQYAQAGSPSAPSPIGKVEQGDGTSSIKHADGTAGLLKVGDPIFENDVVETKTSALGIRFEDGTLFSMSAGARMVINHFVYDTNSSSNSAVFSVVKGTFSMFGGKVVDTGDMRVETPIATLGIRGTSGVCVAVDGANGRCTAVPDPDGTPSELDVLNPKTGELVGTLTDVFSKVVLTPQGALIVPQTAAEIGEAKNLAQILYRLYGLHVPHSPPEFEDPQILKKILFDLDDSTFFQLLPSLVFIPFPVLEQVVVEVRGFAITPIEPVVTPTEVNEIAPAVVTEPIPVTVEAVAQQPTLTVGGASGDEDTAIPLVISSALTDTDGSESLSINISGLPEEATLNQGTLNPDGTYTLTPAQLAGLTITPPADSDADFTLTVTATSTEANGGGTATSTGTILVSVNAIADQPTLTVAPASGGEDTAIALSVSSALTDADGSETLSINISGLPEGATLNQGTLNPDGTYTLTPAQLAGLTITPPDDGDFALIVTATSTEANGGTATSTGTINLTVEDDVPTAVNDTAQSVAEDAASIGGNVLTNDTQGADGATLTAVDFGGGSQTINPSGVTTLTTANGTYTFQADGAWTFDPSTNLNNASGISAGFTYQITDGDGDTSTAIQPITVTDGTNPSVTQNAEIGVDEEGLGTVNATGSASATDVETNTGTVTFQAGSDNIVGVAFTSVAGITADVNGVDGTDIVWTLIGPTQIVGAIGDIDAILIDLTPPSLPIAAGGTGSATVTVTLTDNFPHPAGGLAENVINLTGITVVATDTDGDTAGATVAINVTDDVPTAVNDTASVVQEGQDLNVAFVLDFSGSINNTDFNTMLDAVVDAGRTFFDHGGDVSITVVRFAAGANVIGTYDNVTDFENALDISANSRGINTGGTNYTAALEAMMGPGGYVPQDGSVNQVFFISDGAPNQQFQGTNSNNITHSLLEDTRDGWNEFVGDNGITVTTLGVTTAATEERLQDVDEVDGDDTVIFVANFDDLVDSLLDAVTPDGVSGNVLTGPAVIDGDAFGADGGYIKSITINAITYEWDGDNTITPSSGDSFQGNQLTNIATAEGGKLSFNFTTGDWSYTSPTGGVTEDTIETFPYVVVDGDGDTATADLVVTVINATLISSVDPIVLDLGQPGIEFSSLGNGVQFDINADGLLDQIAWTASLDGILAYDLDLSGIIENGTEIFTPQFAGGSHADGLAALASLDSNNDGVIDAQDAAFDRLVVWQDANHDGVSDPGELKSLSALGITGIDLDAAAGSNATIDGQAILAEGSFTYADGTTGTFVEVEFDVTFGNAEATNGDAYDDGVDAEREADNRNINAAALAASVGFGVATAAASAAIAAPIQLDDTSAAPVDGSDTASGYVSDGAQAGTSKTPVVDPLHGTPGDDATLTQGSAGTTDDGTSAQGLAPVGSGAAQPSSTLAEPESDDKPVMLVTPEGQVTGATVAGEGAHAQHSDAASADDKHVPSSGASFEESKAEPLPEVTGLADHDASASSDAGLPGSALPASLAERLAAVTSLDTNNDGLVDHNDASYSQLAVWQDANQDGVADADELSSLADYGIKGIALNGSMIDGYLDAHSLLAQAPTSGTPLVAIEGSDAQWAKLASLDIGDLLVGGDNYIDIDQALKASALTNAQPEGGAGSSASGPEASASQAASSSPEAAAQAADAPPPANGASGGATGGEQNGQQNQSQDAKNDGPAEADAGPDHAEAASVSIHVDDGAEQAQNHAVA